MQKHGVVQCGFYTEEVREGGGGEGRGRRGPRIGFDVVTMDGKRGPLARVGRLRFAWIKFYLYYNSLIDDIIFIAEEDDT